VNYKIKYIQITTVLFHTILMYLCIKEAISTSNDALYVGVWFPLFWVDLPATLIAHFTRVLVPNNLAYSISDFFEKVFTTWPYSSYWNFWHFALFYGILGAIWWYYLPRIVFFSACFVVTQLRKVTRSRK
jgi:hypothetical protein